MIEIRIGGGAEAAFSRLIGLVDDADVSDWWMRQGSRIAHDWFVDTVRDNIRMQGKLAGERWDYSTEPTYGDYKKKQLGNLNVLRWKGGNEVLYPSLIHEGHPQHIFKVRRNSVSIGTSVPYAARLTEAGTNQFGEPRPARHFMPADSARNKRLVTDLQKSLRPYLEGKGRKVSSAVFNL